MFEVGFSELLVIFALALVVLGPERLPKLAAQVGRWIGRARGMARQFREQLEAEASAIDAAANASHTPPQPNSGETAQPPPTYAAADSAPDPQSWHPAAASEPAAPTEPETPASTVSTTSEPSQPEPSREQRGG